MDNRATESLSEEDNENFNIGTDGELLDAVFCVRCGTPNDADAMICKECGDPLVEQGTELRSRLGRIRRYARGNDLSGLTTQEVKASIRQLLTPAKQNALVNPKHKELILRIAQTARSIDQPQIPLQAPDFLTILLAPIIYALFPVGADAAHQEVQSGSYKWTFDAKFSTRGMIILLLIFLFVAIFAFIFLQRMM